MDDKLMQRIQEVLKDSQYHVYEINWTSLDSQKILQVVVGDDQFQIDLDGCSFVSSLISDLLDKEFDDLPSYFLEVCSPGAERELKTMEERLKTKGCKVFVRLTQPIDSSLEFEGIVESINESSCELTYRIKARKKTITIDMNTIEFMRLAV